MAERDGADVVAVITVELHKNGGVAVLGPVEDKILCLGLLEAGKVAVFNARPQRLVQPVSVMPTLVKP